MVLLDWNISYSSQPEEIIGFLKAHLPETGYIVTLQEVTPPAYSAIKEAFSGTTHMVYSLDYRKPGKYDGRNRKLGVLIMTSGEIKLENARVLDRTVFPDRTLVTDCLANGTKYRVMSLHSITGCDYKNAKAAQFRSFAEAVDALGPDIVTFDANEPEKDHYNVDGMVFFRNDKRGKAPRLFFERMLAGGLCDAYVCMYDPANYEDGAPLATSHLIRGKTPKRYDFAFVRENFNIKNAKYLLEESLAASSDHAAIKVTFE